MEQKIKDCFEALHMSESCAEKIETALEARRPARRRWQPAVAAAMVCAVLVLVATCTPVGRAAVEGVKEVIRSIRGPGYTVTERYEFDEGSYVTEKGIDDKTGEPYVTSIWDTSFPDWLEAGEDSLWFVANGERIDLFGLIDNETPFTYEYTKDGIVYHMAVGGEYDPAQREDILTGRATGLGFGWGAWMSKELSGEWIGGYSRGFFDPQDEELPWATAAKEKLNIPW